MEATNRIDLLGVYIYNLEVNYLFSDLFRHNLYIKIDYRENFLRQRVPGGEMA